MNNYIIRPIQLKDAKEVSNLIVDNLLHVNTKDYPLSHMEKLAAKHTIEDIIEFASNRYMIVAIEDNQVMGVASIYPLENQTTFYIATFFIHTKAHRKGIGKMLFSHIKKYAMVNGGSKLVVDASLSSPDFYENLGFSYDEGYKVISNGENYKMYCHI